MQKVTIFIKLMRLRFITNSCSIVLIMRVQLKLPLKDIQLLERKMLESNKCVWRVWQWKNKTKPQTNNKREIKQKQIYG